MKAIAVMVNIETEDVNSFHIFGSNAKLLAKMAVQRARNSGKAPVEDWQWHIFADQEAEEQFAEIMWTTAKMIETLAGESLPDETTRDEVVWAMEETLDESIDDGTLDDIVFGGITFPTTEPKEVNSVNEAKILLDNLTEEEVSTRLTTFLDEVFDDTDEGEQS